ncbi:glycoside hydrolase family 30 beta sandwich domain-containing protein [Granulicella sp. L46]|uniref:glycoside hydrolase family 30 protein n=1 Tax=Granulicella sp. L46 TaxID=1641865 RepID=UPI00131C839D|nr:glycoside hydrolase family 30 beta sandwich domain-containing protein [Granulicella sp. L46]
MKLAAALLTLTFATAATAQTPASSSVSLYLTSPDRSALLALQPPIAFTPAATASSQTITVNPAKTYQTIDGFGFALTGGSAQLLIHMDPARRAALLQELSTRTGDGIGVSYLRLTVGSSDMNDHVYSYDDLAPDQTDPDMSHFSLDPDKADVIPIMKQILAIDPKIKILASPWSAPLWMKTNSAAQGGVLLPKYFPAYATYLTKYVQGMKAEGIPIDTITIQNEPLNEKNTPSMLMLPPEQAVFIKENLGPAFRKAGIKTGIVLYDHNLDHPLYPLSILQDPAAARYIDGSGFHLYGGTVDAMTDVHNAFPTKNIYFTEQSITQRDNNPLMPISKPVARVMIGVSRNWSKNVLLWNLAADPNNGPHTSNGGCSGCSGALTIDGDNVRRNIAFYTVAQVSKFVPPGSIRIDSNDLDTLPNVAFRTPDGKKVLVVSNITDTPQTFDVHTGAKTFTSTLPAGNVGTYVW